MGRLPQLPTEFYDKIILEKEGEKLGTLLKIDACTFDTLRGRYARICTQVATNTPVKSEITIGAHRQRILHKGNGILCTSCGKVGHTKGTCVKIPLQDIPQSQPTNTTLANNADTGRQQPSEESWEVVTFTKRRRPTKKKAQLQA